MFNKVYYHSFYCKLVALLLVVVVTTAMMVMMKQDPTAGTKLHHLFLSDIKYR